MPVYHAQSQYDDGLEVASSPAPEWTPSHNEYELGQKFSVPSDSPGHYKKSDDAIAGGSSGFYASGTTASRPWYKRKKILSIVAAAFIVLIIVLGVGLGVGLSSGDDSSNESDDSNESSNGKNNEGDENSLCQGELCTKLLAVSNHLDNLYVFGRSDDKRTINYLKHDGSDWGEWEAFPMTRSEHLLSPPTTQTWPVNGSAWRLDVFVVGSRSQTVYNIWHDEKESWPKWDEIGDNVNSSLSTCFVYRRGFSDRLDIWGTQADTGTIIKTLWKQNNDFSEEDFDGTTSDNGGYDFFDDWLSNDALSPPAKGLPAVVCAFAEDDDDRYHDIIWYNDNGSQAFHSYYSDKNGWAQARDFEGPWIGDPSLFGINDNSTDAYFFGVKENHEMHYLSFRRDNSFTNMESLGGNISSIPAVVSSNNGEALDVVALSGKGTLVHQHYDGSGWLPDWEDLGIRASSAPSMRFFGDKLFILAVNANGDLMLWTVDSDIGPDWEDRLDEGENLKGSLSLEY